MGIPDRCRHGNYDDSCCRCQEIEKLTKELKEQIRDLEDQIISKTLKPNQYILDDIDLQEDAYEKLIIRSEHYMMSRLCDSNECDVLSKFINWCKSEMNADIHVKRGPEETSYMDRRKANDCIQVI